MQRSRFSSNSEASASEILENIHTSSYYMDSNVISRFKSSTTHECVARREKLIKTLSVALTSTSYFRNKRILTKS